MLPKNSTGKEAGISVRPDLDNPEWGLEDMFENGRGNLIMLQKFSALSGPKPIERPAGIIMKYSIPAKGLYFYID